MYSYTTIPSKGKVNARKRVYPRLILCIYIDTQSERGLVVVFYFLFFIYELAWIKSLVLPYLPIYHWAYIRNERTRWQKRDQTKEMSPTKHWQIYNDLFGNQHYASCGMELVLVNKIFIHLLRPGYFTKFPVDPKCI